VRRRLLLVTPFAPTPHPRHGGARAVRGLAGALAERHELALVYVGAPSAVDPQLARRCVAVHAHEADAPSPVVRRLRGAGGLLRRRSMWAAEMRIDVLARCVRDLADDLRPAVIQVEHGVLGDVLRAVAPGPSRVLTIHDPAASGFENLPYQHEGLRLAHRLDARVAVLQERRILAAAHAAVVFTERDRQVVAASAPGSTEVVRIPLGHDVPSVALDPGGAQPPTVVFVGSFRHPPNVDAALRLGQEVFPPVRAARPDVVLEIVGESPPAAVLALQGEGVRIHADVPSVIPYINRAAVVVAPIALGGGARVKVLEALAAGKAVVASPRAAEGIGARPGRDIVIAETDAAVAAAVLSLLEDLPAREALGRSARAWALRELSWPAMAARYDELYDRLDRRRRLRSSAARS